MFLLPKKTSVPFHFKIVLVLSFIFASACGDVSNEERVENAISLANQLLTTRDCAAAKQVLDELGQQQLNSQYLITYAASEICETGYSTVDLFTTDLAKLGTTNASILGSLTKFSLSDRSTSTDSNFNYGLSALNTLLYAGGVGTPSHENRAEKFNAADLQEIEVFAIYLSLVQLGKYLYIHGNTDANGRKGTLDTNETNNCLTDYTVAASQAARAAATGASSISPCAGDGDGHSELQTGATDRKKYLCQGVTLFNNLLDLVSNVSISGSSTENLQSLNTAMGTLCADAGLGSICSMKSQSNCESTSTIENIELFFIAVFETMLTDA